MPGGYSAADRAFPSSQIVPSTANLFPPKLTRSPGPEQQLPASQAELVSSLWGVWETMDSVFFRISGFDPKTLSNKTHADFFPCLPSLGV